MSFRSFAGNQHEEEEGDTSTWPIAIVIMNNEFDSKLSQDDSEGSSETKSNAQSLVKALRKLQFLVITLFNWNLEEIERKLEELAKDDYSQRWGLFVAILTNGEDKWLYAKNRGYYLNWLWTYFGKESCPSLADKPKIFLAQVDH